MDLSKDYWENRYKESNIGWDLGEISPPLKNYFDQLTNKNLKILVPGGGNSYEAEYLHDKGFKNVYVVDLSVTALQNIKNRVPSFPSSHLIQDDFFYIDMRFDLIIEQTFFCAIHPDLRRAYATKVFEILHQNGKAVGLLFNVPLNDTKPPFGGCKNEYLEYFKPYFDIKVMEDAKNSIPPRQGKELFFIMQKKNKTTIN